jgi:aspartate aminotransferase-like enzyme
MEYFLKISNIIVQYIKSSIGVDEKQQKVLYTPGPLMTTESVKRAMLRDIGSGDVEFKQIVEHCRKMLIAIAGKIDYNFI